MKKHREHLLPHLLFLGPATMVFLIAIIIPFVISFYYAFTDWNGISPNANFIRLENFIAIFSGKSTFLESFWFTLRLSLVNVCLVIIIGTLIAAVVSSSIPLRGVFRLIFYLPQVIGGLVLGYVWQFIFSKGLTSLGEQLNLPLFMQSWLGKPQTAFWALVIVFTWQMVGYVMVVMTAALTSLPEDIIESANLDGAGSVATFFRIKLPLCMPYMTICTFWVLSNAFKMFELNMSLTAGGPYGSTNSLALTIYKDAFMNTRYGLATAESLIFFLVILVITSIQGLLTKRGEKVLE